MTECEAHGNVDHSQSFFRRVGAAFLALALRLAGDRVPALAFPSINPPSLPAATAAGSFLVSIGSTRTAWTSSSLDNGSSLVSSSICRASKFAPDGRLGLLERLGMNGFQSQFEISGFRI
jgi:hypothetical protein